MITMKHLFLCMSIIVMMLSCSPFRVVSDYDKNYDFSHYKTYTLRLDELKINDIDQSRVTSELHKQLTSKGLTSSENADLIINIKASHKTVRDNYFTPSIHLGGWGGRFGGGFGLGHTMVSEYNQGTLVFDFIDAKTGKMVWQGTGSGIRVDSPEAKQKQIPKIIEKMLQNYPPKK